MLRNERAILNRSRGRVDLVDLRSCPASYDQGRPFGDGDDRPNRRAVLELACGAAGNKFPQYRQIIGIAIDAPKFSGAAILRTSF